MKKLCLLLVSCFIAFFLRLMPVDAKEYTQEDVQQSLASIISIWQGSAPQGTQFNFLAVGNDLALKSTFGGEEYVSHFIFNDGVISFVSDRATVTNEDEFIKSTYDNFNITFLLVGLLNMYDEETKESVKDIQINDSLSMETFTLERDGLTATLINSNIKEITLENGQSLKTEGFIKTIDIDFNHPNFIKFVIDNDGSLIFGSQKKVPTLNLKDVTDSSITIEIGNTDSGRMCKIYKRESNQDFTLLDTVSCSDTHTDTDVLSDTEYSYKIETDEGIESNIKSARTLKKEQPSTTPTEQIPSLKLSNIKMDSITVNFYNTGDAKSCSLYRSKEDGEFEALKTVSCNESYVDSEVYANTKYSYKVEANGIMSEPVSGKTLPKILEPVPNNPKTGIITYSLLVITLVISCIAGLQILSKNKLFKRL